MQVKKQTYASSKLLMASFMPSAPKASVPYGSLAVPDMFLSSDTFSDSSLQVTSKFRYLALTKLVDIE